MLWKFFWIFYCLSQVTSSPSTYLRCIWIWSNANLHIVHVDHLLKIKSKYTNIANTNLAKILDIYLSIWIRKIMFQYGMAYWWPDNPRTDVSLFLINSSRVIGWIKNRLSFSSFKTDEPPPTATHSVSWIRLKFSS